MKPNNKHEEKLHKILLDMNLPCEIVREYRFDVTDDKEVKPRRWRFDFALVKVKIAIEVEGGTWNGGRHVNPIGFEKDCEKYNKAVTLGWRVIRLTPKLIVKEHVTSLIEALIINH